MSLEAGFESLQLHPKGSSVSCSCCKPSPHHHGLWPSETIGQINIFFYQLTWLWSFITATYKQVIYDLNVINLQ